MLRISKFGGLVLAASPYAIPPGGMQQQVNMTLAIPGQLTSRRGSAPVKYDKSGLEGVVEQVFPFSGGIGKPDRALVMDAEGNLAIVDGVTV